ncbi:MAG: flagellar hook-length control protein FliK [Candidatus Sericytochromatia bacterium]|nr:flagellar hook-length control protein FliK [Candidatus Tanganyikabacteria bacterium]
MSLAAPGPVEGPRPVAEYSGVTGGVPPVSGRAGSPQGQEDKPVPTAEGPDGARRALEDAGLPTTPATRSLVQAMAQAGLPATPAMLRRLVANWPDIPAEMRATALGLAARGLVPTAALLAQGPPDQGPPRPAQTIRSWMSRLGHPALTLLAGEGDPLASLMTWIDRLTPPEARLARQLRDPSAGDTFPDPGPRSGEWPTEEAWPQGFARMVDPAAPWTIPLAWGPWTGTWTHWDRDARTSAGPADAEQAWRTVLALEHPECGRVRLHLAGAGRQLVVRIQAEDPALREALAALVPEVSARVAELGWIGPPWAVDATDKEPHGS